MDLNGAAELVLDADADTAISADAADDQIDIKIGGNDDFKLTAKTLAIGGAAAADSKIVFDGNAQDFHIGLDDSADDLVIGLGSTLGTTTHMAFDEAGHITMPLQCAFKAESSADASNVSGDGTSYDLLFQTETFDQNGDFSSPTFTAPVTGRYLITWTTAIYGIGSGHDLTMTLDTSNNNYLNQINLANAERNAEYYDCCAVIADMDASDTAKVTLQVSGGSKTIDTNGAYNYFSAVLLC